MCGGGGAENEEIPLLPFVKRILHRQYSKHHQDKTSLSSHLFLLVLVTPFDAPREIIINTSLNFLPKQISRSTLGNIEKWEGYCLASSCNREILVTNLASIIFDKLINQARQTPKQRHRMIKSKSSNSSFTHSNTDRVPWNFERKINQGIKTKNILVRNVLLGVLAV